MTLLNKFYIKVMMLWYDMNMVNIKDVISEQWFEILVETQLEEVHVEKEFLDHAIAKYGSVNLCKEVEVEQIFLLKNLMPPRYLKLADEFFQDQLARGKWALVGESAYRVSDIKTLLKNVDPVDEDYLAMEFDV